MGDLCLVREKEIAKLIVRHDHVSHVNFLLATGPKSFLDLLEASMAWWESIDETRLLVAPGNSLPIWYCLLLDLEFIHHTMWLVFIGVGQYQRVEMILYCYTLMRRETKY